MQLSIGKEFQALVTGSEKAGSERMFSVFHKQGRLVRLPDLRVTDRKERCYLSRQSLHYHRWNFGFFAKDKGKLVLDFKKWELMKRVRF